MRRLGEVLRELRLRAGLPQDDQGYISLEHDAAKVSDFQVTYVPGLLQTPEYLRAGFARARAQRSRKWVDNQVEVRMLRQKRLTAAEPLRFHAIMLESAPAHASEAQLPNIAKRAQLDNITILTHGAGPNDVRWGLSQSSTSRRRQTGRCCT